MDAHGTSREDVGHRTMVDAGRAIFLKNSPIVPTAWAPEAKVQAKKVGLSGFPNAILGPFGVFRE